MDYFKRARQRTVRDMIKPHITRNKVVEVLAAMSDITDSQASTDSFAALPAQQSSSLSDTHTRTESVRSKDSAYADISSDSWTRSEVPEERHEYVDDVNAPIAAAP
eukprot:UN02877